MDDPSVDDDRKPFELEAGHEEETLPDPDEQLMLDQGNGRVWLVKVPKFLMERWSAIDAEDVHLASLRVYHNAVGPTGKKPRIVLFLPPTNVSPGQAPDPTRPLFNMNSTYTAPGRANEPDSYELEMVNESVDNQIVVAERPKDPLLSTNPSGVGSGLVNPRARTTILTGRIKHDCNLRPVFSETYRRQMKERTLRYNMPKRQIRMIEEAGVPGGRGGVNRLSSGVGVGAGGTFGNLIPSKPKVPKGSFERMARIPRNQLLDLIFNLFRDTPHWGIKPLREKTQQPEVYLKEVLSEVAMLHRSGEFNGLWELKDNFKGDGLKGEGFALAMMGKEFSDDVKMEDVGANDDEEEDEEDEDDMEEVS